MEGPRVKIDMTTEREVDASGSGGNVKIRVPTKTVEPGGTLIYIIRLVNEGDAIATNVVVNNPVPKGAIYVSGSATGKGSQTLVSVDHGASFEPERKLADVPPDAVTDIRWLVEKMPAGSRCTLEFQVTATMQDASAFQKVWSSLYLWLLATFSK